MTENLKLLSIKNFAKEFCIQPSCIYAWLHYQRLPPRLYRKLGRRIIFIRQEVENWFLEGAKLEPIKPNKKRSKKNESF